MIDARIPLGVRSFRGPDPGEQYQRALTMSALVGQQRMQEMQLAEAEREAGERMTMRDILRASPDPEKAIPELYARGLYKPAMDLQKQVDERKKAGLESRRLEGEIGKQERDALLSRLKMFGSAAAAARSPEEFDAAMRALESQGVTGAANLIGRFNDRQALIAPLRDLEKIIEQNTPKMTQAGDRFVDTNPITNPGIGGYQVPMTAAERDASSRGWANVNLARESAERERTNAARGRWQYDADRGGMVNLDTAEFRPATQGGQPIGPKAKDKDPTEGQGKAVLFGSRMQEADSIIRTLETQAGTVAAADAKQAVGNIPLVGGLAERAFNVGAGMVGAADMQKLDQAQRDFINAVLRRESGAVISPQEFENARKQYFPQPGDTAEVINQKRRNRETAIEGMRFEAGRFGDRIGAPAAPKGQTAAGRITPAPDVRNMSNEDLLRGLGL